MNGRGVRMQGDMERVSGRVIMRNGRQEKQRKTKVALLRNSGVAVGLVKAYSRYRKHGSDISLLVSTHLN